MNREKYTSWRKSRRSGEEANCVEVARGSNGSVGVRDSKDTGGGRLEIEPSAWRDFVGGAKAGRHDLR